MDKRTKLGKTEYFLKWNGYTDEENTWEPEENLDCEELIKEFELQFKRREKELRKKKEKPERARKRTLSNSTIASGASSDAGPSKERRKVSPPKPKEKSTEKEVHENGVDKSDDYETIDDEEEEEVEERKEDKDMNDSEATAASPHAGKIPEKIIGATDSSGHLMFLLKWKGIEEADLIAAKDANTMCPQIVIKFYEERLTWHSPDNKNGV